MVDIPSKFGNISIKILKVVIYSRATTACLISDECFDHSIKDFEISTRDIKDADSDFYVVGSGQK